MAPELQTKNSLVPGNELTATGNSVAAATTQIGEGGMIQNPGGGVAHIQKNAEEGAMPGVGVHAMAQGFGIFKGSEWPINPAQHLTEGDFLRRTLQLIAAAGASKADHDAVAL